MARPDSQKILRQNTEFKPEFRVFVQEITADQKAGRFVREIKGFSSIQIAHAVSGVPTATIIFSNINDRYFNRLRTRTWPKEDADASKAYVRKVLATLSQPQLKEVNPARRLENSLQQEFKVPGGSKTVLSKTVRLESGLQLGQEDFTLNIPGNVGSRSSYTETYLNTLFDLGTRVGGTAGVGFENPLTLGLMPRIFIDMKGRDDQIYAGFSGIISGVNDIYTAGAEMSIQLICMGSSRLLELGEIYTLASIQQLEQTIASQDIPEARRELYKSMVFAGEDGVEIIRKVVRNVQAMHCFDAQEDIRAENSNAKTLSQDEFFYKHRFWTVPTEPFFKGNYSGGNPLRKVGAVTDVNAGLFIEEGLPFPDRPFAARPDGVGIQDGDPVDALRGQLLIDERILTPGQPQAKTFQFMINSMFSLYQSQKTLALSIIRKVADVVYYDFFEDPNGNLVFQIPKLNNFPGELASGEFSGLGVLFESGVAGASARQTGSSVISTEEALFQGTTVHSGFFDYSPSPELFHETDHGLNYLITNGGGLNHWSLQENESELVTYVEVPAAPALGFGQSLEVLVAQSATGRTNQEEARELQRRFGLRSVTTQQLLIGKGFFSQRVREEILDPFALAVLHMLNSRSKHGQVGLLARPDLMVGKTVWLVERQRIYFITAVNHNLTQVGGQFQTMLTLSYGHDIGDRIPLPWIQVRGAFAEIPTKDQSEQQAASQQTESKNEERLIVTTNFPEKPVGQEGIERVFGQLKKDVDFTDGPGNSITVSNAAFLQKVTPTIDLVGRKNFAVQIHEDLREVLKQTFASLRPEDQAKISTIKGYQPRRVSAISNSNQPLSFHCWGIAVDVGMGTGYKVGQALPQIYPIADVFIRYGWYWGGGEGPRLNIDGMSLPGFQLRDDIHFQWAYPVGKLPSKFSEDSQD